MSKLIEGRNFPRIQHVFTELYYLFPIPIYFVGTKKVIFLPPFRPGPVYGALMKFIYCLTCQLPCSDCITPPEIELAHSQFIHKCIDIVFAPDPLPYIHDSIYIHLSAIVLFQFKEPPVHVCHDICQTIAFSIVFEIILVCVSQCYKTFMRISGHTPIIIVYHPIKPRVSEVKGIEYRPCFFVIVLPPDEVITPEHVKISQKVIDHHPTYCIALPRCIGNGGEPSGIVSRRIYHSPIHIDFCEPDCTQHLMVEVVCGIPEPFLYIRVVCILVVYVAYKWHILAE